MTEHLDVLIVGAGISGIGAARYLQMYCPTRSFAIVEGRERLGGTWDLFRYPGIRSDSDMHTMGFSFRPWTNEHSIAEGASILGYLEETAHEYGIDRLIRFQHRVIGASWSSQDARWTVELESGPAKTHSLLTCGFLHMCSGYYNYAQGYTPEFPGIDQFAGRVVHPQHWPQDLDYTGKRVLVIGSGATAVTLVPSMAKTAEHVTMLQRSPTYVVSLPAKDAVANRLRRWLPARLAYWLTRWKNIFITLSFYRRARREPEQMSALIIGGIRARLGADYDVATHFTPRYRPWDQRMCFVPDGDLFRAIRQGKASVVTDRIVRFTHDGVQLESGAELSADIVVTATGLHLQLIGGIPLVVDGEPVDLSQRIHYKGTMFSGVPNFASTLGYTNASWTLKAELTSMFLCRLFRYMDRRGYRRCIPIADTHAAPGAAIIDLTSGYVQRSLDKLPRQGLHKPWRLHQNYPQDLLALRYGKLDDGVMQFSR